MVIDAHPWQEFNQYGNTCHHPGCRMTEEEHATIERPALRPGEGQYECFLADQCTGDPRCRVTSPACQHAQSHRARAEADDLGDRDETR